MRVCDFVQTQRQKGKGLIIRSNHGKLQMTLDEILRIGETQDIEFGP